MAAFNVGAEGRSALEILVEGGAAIWAAMFGPGGDESLRMNLEATIAAIRNPEAIGEGRAREMSGEIDELADLVSRAQREGALPTDFEPHALSTLLLAATEGMQLLNGQLQGGVDTDAAWRLLVRMIEGLQAEHPTQASD